MDQPQNGNKTHPPCIEDKILQDFHRLMASDKYKHNRKLLSVEKRDVIISLIQDRNFKPDWFDPEDPRSLARMNSFKYEAKHKYFLNNGHLYRCHLRVEKDGPELVRRQVFDFDAGNHIIACHEAVGHAEESETFAEIERTCYGISRESVKLLLKHCITCNRNVSGRTKVPVQRSLEKVYISLLDMRWASADRYDWILHVKDLFSRYSALYVLTHRDSRSVVKCLRKFIFHYGIPKIFYADNTEELNEVIEDICRRLENNDAYRRSCHPEVLSIIKQANNNIKDKLTCWMSDTGSKNWLDGLSTVEETINSEKHPSWPEGVTVSEIFLEGVYGL